MDTEEKPSLEVLYDHYKESFSYIREREKQRDYLFLVVIGISGLLVLAVFFPKNFQDVIQDPAASGLVTNIKALPFPVITSGIWTFLLIFFIKYGQSTINVERQYEYLHHIEGRISDLFGDKDIFSREGRSYEKNYPIFCWWVWIFYTVFFPIVLIIAITTVLWVERYSQEGYYQYYDPVVYFSIIVSILLYFMPKKLSKWLAKKILRESDNE